MLLSISIILSLYSPPDGRFSTAAKLSPPTNAFIREHIENLRRYYNRLDVSEGDRRKLGGEMVALRNARGGTEEAALRESLPDPNNAMPGGLDLLATQVTSSGRPATGRPSALSAPALGFQEPSHQSRLRDPYLHEFQPDARKPSKQSASGHSDVGSTMTTNTGNTGGASLTTTGTYLTSPGYAVSDDRPPSDMRPANQPSFWANSAPAQGTNGIRLKDRLSSFFQEDTTLPWPSGSTADADAVSGVMEGYSSTQLASINTPTDNTSSDALGLVLVGIAAFAGYR